MSAAGLRRALATLRWPALCAALATHAGLFFLLHAAGTGRRARPRPCRWRLNCGPAAPWPALVLWR